MRYMLRFTLLDVKDSKVPNVEVTIKTAALTDRGTIVTQTDVMANTDNNGNVLKVFNIDQGYRQLKFIVSAKFASGTRSLTTKETTLLLDPTKSTYLLSIILNSASILCSTKTFSFDVDVSSNLPSGSRLTVLVLGRDKILQPPETHTLSGGAAQTINLNLVEGLAPGFKIVIFTISERFGVLSDSQWIQVDGRCQGVTLDITPKKASPKQSIEIDINGAKNSYVALSGVDSALFLLHDDAITNTKIRNVEMDKENYINSSQSDPHSCTMYNSGLSHMIMDQSFALRRSVSSGCEQNVKIIEAELTDNTQCCNLGMKEARESLPTSCSQKTNLFGRWRKISSSCRNGFSRCCDRIRNPKPVKVVPYGGGWDHMILRRIGHIPSPGLPGFPGINDGRVYFSASSPRFEVAVDGNRGITLDSDSDIMFEHSYDSNDYGYDYDYDYDPSIILEDISSYRTDFEETLAWSIVDLDANGEGSMRVTSRDSITEWTLRGIGVSNELGLEVSPLAKLNVVKDVFLDVHMPLTVIRGEQISVKVTVHNYLNHAKNLTIHMKRTRAICVDARPGHWSDSKPVTVPSKGTQTVSWAFVPMETGSIELTFAAIDNLDAHDAVTRIINVEYEGVPRIDTLASFVLDKDATNATVKIELPADKEIVPGSEQAYIRIIGNTLLPSSVGAKITDIDNMLRMPSGCGEQTLSKLGITTFVASYLDLTGQLNGGTRDNAIEYMKTGINGMMKYRKKSGAFGVWTTSSPSTWLSAFAAKTFSKSLQFGVTQYDLTKEKICPALEFVSRQQKYDGSFLENYRVMHYTRYVQENDDAKILEAAFILISMYESNDCNSEAIQNSKTKARSFVESGFRHLSAKGFWNNGKSAYALSMITYALTLAESSVAREALSTLNSKATTNNDLGVYYWKVDEGRHFGTIRWLQLLFDYYGGYYDDYSTNPNHSPLKYASSAEIETAAYALLAYLKGGTSQMRHANSVVRWLIYQRESGGAFRSTQDTVIAIQALSEYNKISGQAGINIQVNMRLPVTGISLVRNIDVENYLLRTQYKITQELGQQIQFKASAMRSSTIKGSAQIQIELRYNEADLREEDCAFRIRVPHDEIESSKQSSQWFNKNGAPSDNLNEILSESETEDKLTISVPIYIKRLSSEDKESGMVIVEMFLFSGFKSIEESLDMIWNDFALNVDKYEITPKSVIFYLSKVEAYREIKLLVKMRQEQFVAKISPAPIHVYEYYSKDIKCTKFYHPDGESSQIDIRNDGMGGIKCLEGICPVCYGNPNEDPKNQEPWDKETLHTTACQGDGKIDFVIMGMVLDSVDDPESGMVATTVKINHALKNGNVELDTGDEIKIYSVQCPCPKFEEGKNYLVMGGEAIEGDGPTRQIKFTLDDVSYVEEYTDNSVEILKLKEDMEQAVCRH